MLCAALPRRLSLAALAIVTALVDSTAAATKTELESGGDFLARRGVVVGATAPCSSVWQQCGGNDWTGPTCCDEGAFCFDQSEWYSQCKPGTVSPTPSPPPTAPSPAPTSQPTPTASPTPVQSSAGARGFWYSAFSAGGTGAVNCAPVTGSLETAPGSNTYTQSAWFDGNSPSTWCTGTNPNQGKPWISYFTSGEIAFPGNFGVDATQWQPITNSFAGGMDDFEVKWFTVGGGGTVWDTTQLNYLLGDCSGGKSLTEIIKDAGYTGVMIDYEDESGLAPQQLVDFMSDFDASMKLSFTAMGTGGGLTATSTLTQALADPSVSGKWESVVPQLYDASSCLYATQFMSQAKTLFADVEPSKILLGIPQGVDPTTCCTDFADTNGGFVEWLYRPVPQA